MIAALRSLEMLANSGSNGHFSPLTLSIKEEASADAAWRESFASSEVGVKEPAEEELRRIAAETLDLSAILQSVTSVHEHNHFATHTGSAYGVLITYVSLLRHALITSLTRAGESSGGEEILSLYDQVLFSLTSFSPDWTQARAVTALNLFFSKFNRHEPAFVTNNPEAPACPDPRFAYVNLLESVALLVERRYAGRYMPSVTLETILRVHERDHLIYFSLLEALQEQLMLRAPAELALKMSLAGPVPYFGSTEGIAGPVQWEAFHPGYRLAHLVQRSKAATEPAAKAILSAASEGRADDAAYHIDLLEDFLKRFSATGVMRYSGGVCVRDTPLSGEALRERIDRGGRDLLDQVGFGFYGPILDHAIDAYNAVQDAARLSFVVAHVSEIRGHVEADARLAAARDRRTVFSLFSTFDGQIRSVYFGSKPEAVQCGVYAELQNAWLTDLALGRSPAEARARLQTNFARHEPHGDGWVPTLIDHVCEDLAVG